MFRQEMLDRVLREATEETVEVFRALGPFRTKNSDIPLELDFNNLEFRNEVHINEDDEIYIGQFKVGTNVKEGRGIMLTASKDLYEGYWVNNEKCGKGRMIFCNGDVYQGEWANSQCQGHGIFDCEEGQYKGEWVCDQREGFGTFIWADGRKYTGEWLEDKQHGKVAYIDAQGRKRVGEYIEGELVHYDDNQQASATQGDPDNPFLPRNALEQLPERKLEHKEK